MALAVIPVFLLAGGGAWAQKPDSLRYQTVEIKPLHLFISGLRVDYDRQVAPHVWLSSGAEFYYRINSDQDFPYVGDYDFMQLTGYGVSGAYKVFFFHYRKQNKWKPEGSYMSAGLLFQNFFTDFQDDFGLPYKQRTYKLGVNFLVGHQVMAGDYAFVGVYGGVGMRKAWHDAKEDIVPMSNYVWEYGFSGIVPVLGMKIGFWF